MSLAKTMKRLHEKYGPELIMQRPEFVDMPKEPELTVAEKQSLELVQVRDLLKEKGYITTNGTVYDAVRRLLKEREELGKDLLGGEPF